jgi:uncharacterized protein YuzE
MKSTYDQKVDVLYVYLRDLKPGETVHRTVEVADGVQIDMDADGNPIGLEVLWASERYPMAELQGLPGTYG